MFEVPEWHKLHNITNHSLAWGGSEDTVIPIQNAHEGEIGLPNPDNDERHGQRWGLHYGLDCLVHVRECTICQQQQDMVGLQQRTRNECISVEA